MADAIDLCPACGSKQVRLDDGKTPMLHRFPIDCIAALAARVKKLESKKSPYDERFK